MNQHIKMANEKKMLTYSKHILFSKFQAINIRFDNILTELSQKNIAELSWAKLRLTGVFVTYTKLHNLFFNISIQICFVKHKTSTLQWKAGSIMTKFLSKSQYTKKFQYHKGITHNYISFNIESDNIRQVSYYKSEKFLVGFQLIKNKLICGKHRQECRHHGATNNGQFSHLVPQNAKRITKTTKNDSLHETTGRINMFNNKLCDHTHQTTV